MPSPASVNLRPLIRTLARAEMDAILTRNHLGRVAYNYQGAINVEPLHYVYDGASWIYARTSEGEKFRLLNDSYYRIWPVAFEVDEAEGFFRWRSVVVHGDAYLLLPPEDGGDAAEWDEAVEFLRRLVPEAFGPDDPVPSRRAVFRIAALDATGRESTAVI